MKRILFFILFFPLCSHALSCVILLHGLARSHASMSKLETYLKKNNYSVINLDYPSTRKTIHNLAEENIPPMINACLDLDADDIDFVTHSLGGIVLRDYLQHHRIPKLKRIVMLSPPNQGSPLADFFHDNWLFQVFRGPAGQALTTLEIHFPYPLPSQYEVGIIAGNVSPFGKLFFDEPNDGKVAVSSTYLDGINDFIVMPVTHTFMMKNKKVMYQILFFLNYGKFEGVSKDSFRTEKTFRDMP